MKIAVDNHLTSVKNMLKERGYTIVDAAGHAGDVNAVVTSGADDNLASMQGSTANTQVINATEKSPYEVLSLIREMDLAE